MKNLKIKMISKTIAKNILMANKQDTQHSTETLVTLYQN